MVVPKLLYIKIKHQIRFDKCNSASVLGDTIYKNEPLNFVVTNS